MHQQKIMTTERSDYNTLQWLLLACYCVANNKTAEITSRHMPPVMW